MADRNDFTNAVSGVTLGMLANDCAIAIARRISGESLTTRDETALKQARDLLTDLGQLAGDKVVIGRTAIGIGSVLALDEAIQPSRPQDLSGKDLSSTIEYLLRAVESVLASESEEDQKALAALASFFERLAAVAREMSEALISPDIRRQSAWTEPLLSS